MRHGIRQLPGHAEGRRHRVLRGRNDPARALIRHSHAELVEASKKMSRHHDRTANKGPSQRQLRVGEMLRHALSDVLRRRSEEQTSELQSNVKLVCRLLLE